MSQSTAMTTLAPGDLDLNLNQTGQLVVQYPNATDTGGECIEEGPDGKIYIGGGVDAEGDEIWHKLGIACFNKDGTPYTAFGKNGYVILSFGPGKDTHLRQIHFLTVNGEPRILLSGIDTKSGEVVLARLHADGSADEDFGINGLLTVKAPQTLAQDLGLGSNPWTAVATGASGPCAVADGKIYVVMEIYMPIWIATVALLIRLNTDGSFDNSFNGTGFVAVTNQHWGHSSIKDVLVHNGKITVCGTLARKGMVARLNDNGTFDTDFAESGFKLFPEADFEALCLSSGSSVVVAGSSAGSGALAGLTDKGDLDPAFNNGKVLIQSFDDDSFVMFRNIGVTGGKIIVAGRMGVQGGQPLFVVARYSLGGILDVEFGRGKGWSATRFEGHYTVAQGMALQKDGNILIVGDWTGFSVAALVARFVNTAQ
ncbi:delta-60 repeat domain-containing protein [Pseudomonas sp. Ant30-3]|uniref:delta-60 repeat domain-containing protein n=1 Tax=Pseudomonas sp. Ant30-3 TaxID=1488328 RepID=UPI0004914573|nr:delta-60 repeat domain-containing protein [Pseudomonas sp. Ant30-3]